MMTQSRKLNVKIVCLPNKKPTPDKREWAKQAIVWGPEGGPDHRLWRLLAPARIRLVGS